MPRLSLQSVSGGVGRTTLLAHLACAWQRLGLSVLAVDFNPQGQLAMHLGMAPDEADGLIPRWRAQQDWARAAFEVDGVRLLPFGHATPPDLRIFEDTLSHQPYWLASQLDRLALPPDTYVLIDCPPQPSIYASQAAHASALCMGVLRPDALALLTVHQLDDWLNEDVSGAGSVLALNGVDPTRELSGAVLDLVRNRYRERLSPHVIHLDHALTEALAADASVFDHAPHSQSAHDLNGLARWLLARLDATAELARPAERA